MLQQVYIHDTFIYAGYFNALYTRQILFLVFGNVVWLSREPKAKYKLVEKAGESDCDSCEVALVQVKKCSDDVTVVKLRCERLTTMWRSCCMYTDYVLVCSKTFDDDLT